ncbi:MAG: DNA polymerase III subunit delta [Defluviicoccus sp.]|nr:DNA polymerase III subunit delta [Defluviicoccus sp.]
MKIAPARAERFLAAPPEGLRACLFYGPDGGLVRERAQALGRRHVGDLGDAFRVASVAPAALADEPGLLADEAAQLSLTGETRLVRLEGAADAAAEACRMLLERGEAAALVVVEAGELAPRSKLRRLFEEAGDAAAIACYADDEAALKRLIRETFDAAGIAIEPDAAAFLVERLGADRKVTRSELDKLVLYAGESGRITLEDAAASCGAEASLTIDELCDAAAGGHAQEVIAGCDALAGEGVHAVAILRAAQRHFSRLQLAAARTEAGAGAEGAIKALRPPVFFRRQPAFRAALGLWSASRAGWALERLVAAEAACKRTGAPAAALSTDALLAIAHAAKREK